MGRERDQKQLAPLIEDVIGLHLATFVMHHCQATVLAPSQLVSNRFDHSLMPQKQQSAPFSSFFPMQDPTIKMGDRTLIQSNEYD